MINVRGYAARDAQSPLTPFVFERRDPGPRDVQIEILFCGICHTDLHQCRNDWGNARYPMVPGHEIVGRVVRVGAQVKKLKEGDIAAVGCMVDSCRKCAPCKADLEQYCAERATWTYNSKERGSERYTLGGYSEQIVVDKHFVATIPKGLDLKGAAPLLCAGITSWSPLRHWKVGKGQKVGVIGLGGLGHMGVKFAKALGARVVMITTSASKGKDAKRLGADDVLLSTDPAAIAKHAGSFDFLLNTIPVSHDVNPYLALLKLDRPMVLVGVLTRAHAARAGVEPDHRPQDPHGLGDRRHGGDARDARLLRRARHRQRRRGRVDSVGERGLRAAREERREVSLRHRHEHAEDARCRPGVAHTQQAACALPSLLRHVVLVPARNLRIARPRVLRELEVGAVIPLLRQRGRRGEYVGSSTVTS